MIFMEEPARYNGLYQVEKKLGNWESLRYRMLMLIWFFMILFKNYLINSNLMN